MRQSGPASAPIQSRRWWLQADDNEANQQSPRTAIFEAALNSRQLQIDRPLLNDALIDPLAFCHFIF